MIFVTFKIAFEKALKPPLSLQMTFYQRQSDSWQYFATLNKASRDFHKMARQHSSPRPASGLSLRRRVFTRANRASLPKTPPMHPRLLAAGTSFWLVLVPGLEEWRVFKKSKLKIVSKHDDDRSLENINDGFGTAFLLSFISEPRVYVSRLLRALYIKYPASPEPKGGRNSLTDPSMSASVLYQQTLGRVIKSSESPQTHR